MSNQTDRILAKLSKTGNIDVADLPHDLMKFYGECSAKDISLDSWNKIAISLYSHGEADKYNAIMHYISTVEMDKSIHDTPQGRIYKRNINNTAIQVLLAKASKEENIEARNGFMQQAIQTLNTSKIRDVKSQNYSIQGFINFYQNKQIGLTLKNLQNACVSEKSDIIDILGQGQVSFYAKDYAKALEFFKDALMKNPRLPGRARLGLAYCFYMQKKYELSKRAFQRVLDLDPTVIEAYLGMAVLAAQKQDWKEYVRNLNKAHECDSRNPLVLYYITEFYYLQQDIENVKKSGFKAINSLKAMPKIIIDADKQKLYVKPHRIDFYDIKSRLYFMIGSCYHREKKLDLTQKFYEASISANRGNIPANYGMAQLLIQNQQYDSAFKRLEEIRNQSPENEKEITFEVFKPLAYLLSKQAMGHNKQVQQQFYQKALQYFPKDYEAQLEYANNLTEVEPAESLKFFRAALAVLQEKKEIIHQEIYNNIGVLELHLKNYPAAKSAFEKALEIAAAQYASGSQSNSNGSNPAGAATTEASSSMMEEEPKHTSDAEESETKRISFLSTVKFNMAVLQEELNRMDDAITLYNEVLQYCPYYLDAYVRLANIALIKGNFQLAIQYCDDALQKKEEAHTPAVRSDLILCMKGYIQSQYEDDHSARDSFYMIKKSGFNDNYSKLYVSHMDYEQIIEKRDNYDFQKRILMIGDRVKEILGSDPTNVQALIMLGVVLAENGQMQEAKEILNVLKENIGVFPNIFFNLGQIAFLEKNFSEALIHYKKYLEKVSSKDYDSEYLMTQIALCYVHMDNFPLAKRTIKKLILHHPASLIHRYNYFMILHTEIEKVFSDQTRSLKEKEAAFIGCKRAREFLDFLKNDTKCKKSRYSDHFSAHVKQRRMDFYNSITEQCETKKLILDSNIVSFEKMLNEARHKQNTSSQNQNSFDDIVRKWKIDQEIKKQRAEEEKRLEEIKDAEKRNERQRKLEELQELLDKQPKDNTENNKKSKRSSEGGKMKRKRLGGGKKGGNDDDDFLDNLDDLISDGNDDLGMDDDDINFEEEDDAMGNDNFNEDEEQAGGVDKVRNKESSSRKEKSRKIRQFSKHAAADDDDEKDDEMVFGGSNPAFQSSREPPLQKKKKKILRKNKRSNSVDKMDDYLNELDDPDLIFDGDSPLAAPNDAIDTEKKPSTQVVKKNKGRAIASDDEDEDNANLDNIFGE